MISANDFRLNEQTLSFKRDDYPLSKIKDARVKTNTFKDHALRIVSIGLIVGSVVWMICPESMGLFTAPVAIAFGIMSALFSTRKYELKVEFQHTDETGIQWISVAKSNSPNVKNLFETQAKIIRKNIT
ncbi:hypothetical protein ACKBF6_003310 [Vibrio cholerae]